jgi:hypothetical protein
LFGTPSLRFSPGSACPFEFVSCPLVIFNLHLSSMLIGVSPTLQPYAQLICSRRNSPHDQASYLYLRRSAIRQMSYFVVGKEANVERPCPAAG